MKNLNDKIDEIYKKINHPVDENRDTIKNRQILQSLNNQISST